MAGSVLLVSDFIISFMWVWSSVLIKLLIFNIIGFSHHDPIGEFMNGLLKIINMFFFALLGKITSGGAYNPLTVLSSAITGDSKTFLFVLGARIPAQMDFFGFSRLTMELGIAPVIAGEPSLAAHKCDEFWINKSLALEYTTSFVNIPVLTVLGSIYGVRLILETLPEAGRGPSLNVSILHGALTEGLLTFAIVTISQILSSKVNNSFFMKTWISSVCKLSLNILGSDFTGGSMNPASVIGWAYARGDHLTMEHLLVYWLGPIEATLLACLHNEGLRTGVHERRGELETIQEAQAYRNIGLWI
ncbi:hypothetical protein ACFE04_030813 [Oxalis oulophora]